LGVNVKQQPKNNPTKKSKKPQAPREVAPKKPTTTQDKKNKRTVTLNL
jgi:hypothetical protein